MFECYEDFGEFVSNRVTALRSKTGVSARDMSLSMGQGENYLYNIENKKSLPSMRGFYYICEYLKIEPKDFFNEGIANPEKLNEIINDLKSLNDEQLTNVSAIVKDIKR